MPEPIAAVKVNLRVVLLANELVVAESTDVQFWITALGKILREQPKKLPLSGAAP